MTEKFIITRWLVSLLGHRVDRIEVREFTDPVAALRCMQGYSKLGNHFTVEVVEPEPEP